MPQRVAAVDPNEDLGALLRRLLDVVVEHETPILANRGLSMWEYVIVSRLAAGDGVTQKQLASSSRRDPTRLGVNLDALASRGLVDRAIDDTDRRRHLVRLTAAGRELLSRVRADIAAMENEVTGDGSAALRSGLVAALEHIHNVETDGRPTDAPDDRNRQSATDRR